MMSKNGIETRLNDVERYAVFYSQTGNEAFFESVKKSKEAILQTIEELMELARDCYMNWDCDSDAHKYNTICRACEAEKLYMKYKKE